MSLSSTLDRGLLYHAYFGKNSGTVLNTLNSQIYQEINEPGSFDLPGSPISFDLTSCFC